MATDSTNTIMRTVSFVERIEIEYHGNIITQAMVLADVDNDAANELVVGNIEGHIAIFKGDFSTAWKKTTVSGMLTCLAVGEIHTPNKNSLVCMTAEGWCYVYDISAQNPIQSNSFGAEEPDDYRQFHPVFTQELPANARVMCLADIDSDGQVEMVIGYSDRVVRAFRWHTPLDSDIGHFVPLQKWQLAGQIGSITINYDKKHKPELMVSQPGATFVTLQVRPQPQHSLHLDSQHLDKLCVSRPDSSLERSGSFTASLCGDRTPSRQGSVKSNSRVDGTAAIRHDSGGSQHSTTTAAAATTKAEKLQAKKSSDLNSNNSSKVVSPNKLEDKLSVSNSAGSDSGRRNDSSNPDSPREAQSNTKLPAPDSLSDAGDVFDKSQGRLSQLLDSSFETYGSMLLAPMTDSEDSYIIYHPLAHSQSRNKDTSTVIIGGINRGRPPTHTSAVVPGGTNSSSAMRGKISEQSSGEHSQTSGGGNNDSLSSAGAPVQNAASSQLGRSDSGRGRLCSDAADSSQSQATYYALATLDGSLNLVENDTILWSLHVDHYLFTLAKLDVTGNGKEEVVCCAWSGQTYIVNHSKETVRYDFPDSVAAFCAGYYSVRDHVNVPCFVYATFNNRICIYPNITLPRVESTNLMKVMGRKEETKELLHKLNINGEDTSTIRKLYHWCLYGQHRK